MAHQPQAQRQTTVERQTVNVSNTEHDIQTRITWMTGRGWELVLIGTTDRENEAELHFKRVVSA